MFLFQQSSKQLQTHRLLSVEVVPVRTLFPQKYIFLEQLLFLGKYGEAYRLHIYRTRSVIFASLHPVLLLFNGSINNNNNNNNGYF